MARRTLRTLRFLVKLTARKWPWEHVAGVGRPQEFETIPAGGKLCELTAGSQIEVPGHGVRPIVQVRLEDCDPPDQQGRVVTSGKAWLPGRVMPRVQ